MTRLKIRKAKNLLSDKEEEEVEEEVSSYIFKFSQVFAKQVQTDIILPHWHKVTSTADNLYLRH
jgi:hypothetical protein